jgi:hypothetical protein
MTECKDCRTCEDDGSSQPDNHRQRSYPCYDPILDVDKLPSYREKIVAVFCYLKPVDRTLNSNPHIVPNNKNLQREAEEDQAKNEKEQISAHKIISANRIINLLN